jgi:acyl-CoA reductase-like NAD-dependent aldehyde dehydrogenase
MRDVFIDGQWRPSDGEDRHTVTSPRDDGPLETVPTTTPMDVNTAVAAATQAEEPLREMGVYNRAEALAMALDALDDQIQMIAETMAQEAGKPLSEARAEIKEGIHSGREYGHDAARLFGEVPPSTSVGRHNFTRREPYGATAVVTPWNYPFEIPAGHLFAAIVVGNPVVWNPATATTLTGYHLAEALSECPLPDGTFNFVPGPGSTTGDALVKHEAIRLIAFTGSTAVGQSIAASAAGRSAECLLELGGKDPILVLTDADVEAAADAIVFGSNYNCGQSCSGTERVIATEAIYDELVAAVAKRTRELTVGDPLDPETDIGPPVNDDVRETVQSQLRDAVEADATVVAGGDIDGQYIEPTVLADVTPEMTVAREETFGPLTPILMVSDAEQAIKVANDTRYGLQAAVFTESLQTAHRMVKRLCAGGVVVNATNNYWEHHLPFGGIKESGSGGRFKGKWHLEAVTQVKAVSIAYGE